MSMAFDLKPYRVEWRFGMTHWILVGECESHDEARALAQAHAKKHHGEARMIVQHVVERAKYVVERAK
jgi:hypothetical protein